MAFGVLMLPKLTDHQKSVYEFIVATVISEHSTPTFAEISKSLGYKSPNTANDTVKTLIKKGWLVRRNRLKSASYKLANVEITIKDIESE